MTCINFPLGIKGSNIIFDYLNITSMGFKGDCLSSAFVSLLGIVTLL